MRNYIIAIVPAVLIAAVAVGCGGGGSKTINIPGGGKVSVSGKLPSNFPSDFPVYKGASVQGSYTGSQNGIKGSVVTWTTGDAVDKVSSYYDSQFKSGPWKSQSSGNANGSAFWVVDSPDGKEAGYVGVSNDGKNTTIVATIGDKGAITGSSTSTSSSTSGDTPTASDTPDTSSSSGSTPSAPLPNTASLPSDYPSSRVPLPSNARVTSATSLTSNGQKSYYIEIYVQESPSALNDYFKNEMPKNGWTNAFSSESNGSFVLTFGGATAADASGNENLAITVEQSDTPGYAKASIIASVK
ncbi:MAG TPA: hypothetical protein VEZ14_05560 [Dehalococcoidia bacterium]|nr:hypothetical protein [Dehalococcoidia bacterium]